jgi:hypothetical protein
MNKERLKIDILISIKDKNVKQRKNFLIDCLKYHGKIKENDEESISEKQTIVCSNCKSSNIYFTTYEKICKECGITEQSYSRDKREYLQTPSKSFIVPGTTKIGNFDLSKVATWVEKNPEDAKLIRTSNEIIDAINKLGRDIPQTVINDILSMWINILNTIPTIRNPQKDALQALAIYYILSHKNFNINLIQISSIFNDNIREIKLNTGVMERIFKETPWEIYTTFDIGVKCDIETTNKEKQLINRIKEHMSKDKYFSDPLTTTEHIAIIYYIRTNIIKKKVSINELSKNCSKSTTTISTYVKKIKKFYEENPKLEKKLS